MQRSTLIAAVAALAAFALHCGSRTPLAADEKAEEGGKAPTKVILPATDGPLRCVSGDLVLTRSRPDVMFLVDRSGSMAQPLGGDLGAAKWDVMWGALSGLVSSLDETAEVGVKFFPIQGPETSFRDPATACRVGTEMDVEPKRGASPDVLDAFSVTTPGGGTPTAAAVDALVAYYATGKRKGRPHFAVLATDGAPTCNEKLDSKTCVCTSDMGTTPGCQMDGYDCLDDDRAVAAVRRAATDARMPVYVLGLGNPAKTEFTRTLDAMAIAGGRARAQKPAYYEAKNGTELYGSLAEIGKSATRCSWEVASRPDDPNGVVVRVDGRTIPRDPTRAEGWDWVDRDYGQIAFFGQACEIVADDARAVNMSASVTCSK